MNPRPHISRALRFAIMAEQCVDFWRDVRRGDFWCCTKLGRWLCEKLGHAAIEERGSSDGASIVEYCSRCLK